MPNFIWSLLPVLFCYKVFQALVFLHVVLLRIMLLSKRVKSKAILLDNASEDLDLKSILFKPEKSWDCVLVVKLWLTKLRVAVTLFLKSDCWFHWHMYPPRIH